MASNDQDRGAEDREDDFEDFGGFEAADPVPDQPTAQAQAAASPWAVFNSGNAPGQPDLLCAQNCFPNYLDPLDIPGPVAGAGPDVNLNNTARNPPDLQPTADLICGQLLSNQVLSADNVLDGTLNAAARTLGIHSGPNPISGCLPDIGLGNNENRMYHQQNGQQSLEPRANDQNLLDQAATPHLELPKNSIAASQPVERCVVDPHMVLQDRDEAEIYAGREQPAVAVVEAGANATGEIAEMNDQGAPKEAAAEDLSLDGGARNSALQQRIADLIEANRRLEEELDQCREELAAQRSRLQEVQARHEAQLEEVRAASNDALAVVVEQYKEQTKIVVLEQQEEARRHITETARQQMRAFQEMLLTHKDSQEQAKQEQKVELDRQIAQALEQSRQEQEDKFQAFLVEEQEKQRKATERALEGERAASQEKVQEAIADEIERGRARLEEARTEACERLNEDKRSQEAALAILREEEKQQAQEQIINLVREERERGRQIMRQAVEASRQESLAYLQEQRHADSLVRQRHLSSLDVFLESSRRQIALLMETERHRPSPSLPTSSLDSASALAAAGSSNTEKEPLSSSAQNKS